MLPAYSIAFDTLIFRLYDVPYLVVYKLSRRDDLSYNA